MLLQEGPECLDAPDINLDSIKSLEDCFLKISFGEHAANPVEFSIEIRILSLEFIQRVHPQLFHPQHFPDAEQRSLHRLLPNFEGWVFDQNAVLEHLYPMLVLVVYFEEELNELLRDWGVGD